MDKIKIEKDKIEKVTEKGSQTAGKAMKNVLQFATDSIGLLVLKKGNNKDLAYKIIKTGRDIADTAGKLTETSIKTGGVLAGGVINVVKSDKVKNAVGGAVESVKNTVAGKMNSVENDLKRSEELKNIRTKISRIIKEKMDETKDFAENIDEKTEKLIEEFDEKGKSFEEKVILPEGYEESAKEAEYEEVDVKESKEEKEVKEAKESK